MSAAIEGLTSDRSHSDHKDQDHDHDLGDAASLDKIQSKIDEGQIGLTAQLAQQSAAAATKAEEDEVPAFKPVAYDEVVGDESGVDPKDIELVMNKIGCSREKAISVLRQSGGDLINAIMAASEE